MTHHHTFADEARALLTGFEARPLPDLLAEARATNRRGHGRVVTYSRKVFIPLTRLCRDVCGYCTFAASPRQVERPYLLPEEIIATARAGQAAGCHDAPFTLGDKPELRYRAARDALAGLGFASTVDYAAVASCLPVHTKGGR